MKLVATCNSKSDAESIADRLRESGIEAHYLEKASANVRIAGIPNTGNVIVAEEDVVRAQALIQREFPSQRSAGPKLCARCEAKGLPLDLDEGSIGRMDALWIAFRAAFFFKNYCPCCRGFY